MPTLVLEIQREAELESAANALLQVVPSPGVIAFYGEMGAGKTTFIKVFCKLLGVKENMSSPTFSLINEYQLDSGSSVYHFDFYRIQRTEEAFDLGYEDYFYGGNYCLVEWPERVESLLPEKTTSVEIKVIDGKRVFTISY